MKDLIRITKNLTFSDVRERRVQPIDAYAIQVRDWIVEPCRYLSRLYPNNTDHGMALLGIELMFFEPHGQYLTGEDSIRQSKKIFCLAFENFRQYLHKNGFISDDIEELLSESFYRFARCGLFHRGIPDNELLVDAASYGEGCISKNTILSGWLVNPWQMLDAIEGYIQAYIKDIKDNPNGELANNFNKTFNRLIKHAIHYFDRVDKA